MSDLLFSPLHSIPLCHLSLLSLVVVLRWEVVQLAGQEAVARYEARSVVFLIGVLILSQRFECRHSILRAAREIINLREIFRCWSITLSDT